MIRQGLVVGDSLAESERISEKKGELGFRLFFRVGGISYSVPYSIDDGRFRNTRKVVQLFTIVIQVVAQHRMFLQNRRTFGNVYRYGPLMPSEEVLTERDNQGTRGHK